MHPTYTFEIDTFILQIIYYVKFNSLILLKRSSQNSLKTVNSVASSHANKRMILGKIQPQDLVLNLYKNMW